MKKPKTELNVMFFSEFARLVMDDQDQKQKLNAYFGEDEVDEDQWLEHVCNMYAGFDNPLYWIVSAGQLAGWYSVDVPADVKPMDLIAIPSEE